MPDHVFNFKPSKQYLCFLTLITLTSLIMIIVLPVTVLIKIIVFAITVMYCASMFWRFGLLKSDQAIIAIQYIEKDQWKVSQPHVQFTASLLGESTVTSLLAILRFRIAGQRHPKTCIIFRDSLGMDGYRRLVALLTTAKTAIEA